jgi:hypothetical protein
MFTFILGITALFVALCGAYFSVLGIATLFSGSFVSVTVMASSLELGKVVATSFLYRYWHKTSWLIRLYLLSAILILMVVTSVGVFGYLSAAYQTNSVKFSQLDQQVSVIESQKSVFDSEIQQNNKRIETLNELRVVQEQRVQDAGNYKVPREQAYAAIEKANQEIQTLSTRNQELQAEKFKKDGELIEITKQTTEIKDIGTFKFVANVINKPLDTVVIAFICVLICVFDPLAVTLILAFNIALGKRHTLNDESSEEDNIKKN